MNRYRYAKCHGYIVVGALNTRDALKEIERSMIAGSVAVVGRLEIWNTLTKKYELIIHRS